MINLFKKKNSRKLAFLAIFLLVFLFFNVNYAKANFVTDLLGGVVNLAQAPMFLVLGTVIVGISWLVGQVSTLLIFILGKTMGYNSFISEPMVGYGWVMIRDICNMFFILILLVIAFAAILRIESYQWKKTLPKLLIMAVLINFSKTLCGLAIDFSQVIMLTFFNGINGGGDFFNGAMVNALGLQNVLTFKTATVDIINSIFTSDSNPMTVFGSLLFGFIILVIACIVVGIYTIILMFRIVTLWILIILSPLAFLAMAFPAGAKYASQWSGEFIKNIIVGPVLIFFLWLALLLSQQTFTSNLNLISVNDKNFNSGILTKIGAPDNLANFILVIVFLLGGLMAAQQLGASGSSMAGSALNKIKSAGSSFAKGAGKAAGYIPAQYAKRAGYELGDMALGRLKKMPMIGNLATAGQAKLRMHRDYAEEKDTRYMQYLEEQDLDRVIARQRTGGGFISGLLSGKGMESKRQMFKGALVEKMKRGDEWGPTKEEKMANKTRAMIDLAQMGGHSITASGEDAFRDADLLKLWHEFRYKNAGMIDDEQMKTYFFGGQGNAAGPGGARTGDQYNYKGLKGADNSEYYRKGGWQDPNTGFWYDHQNPTTGQGEDFVSPNSMLTYTLSRMRMNDVHGLHHENLFSRKDAHGNDQYDALEAVYADGNGTMRTLAQIRDRGTRQQKAALRSWMEHRLSMEQAPGYAATGGSTYFRDIESDYQTVYQAAHPGATATREQFLDASMANGGLQTAGGRRDRLGAARAIMGKTNSVEVASGITGLDRINRGVLAANFSELGLEKVAARHFDGADKAEIAGRIGSSLRENGVAENIAKAVEEQINKASYLILHNKEAGISGSEGRTAHAHELMHARLGANFNQDELKGVWNSMDENSKNDVRKQISSKWGGNMSEEAIMNEYFAEGLTAKTRWGKGAILSLNQTAESGLDGLLKTKGSNITAFTSNIMKNKPTSDDVRQSMVNNVDGSLKKTLDELIGTLKDVGDGFGSIEKFSSNLGSLQRSIERNQTSLEKSVKGYKEVANKLNNLANKTA